jgi:GTP-binding protein HflX
MTDTVGFIRKLPHQLVDAFASTLEETTLADIVVVVADASLEAGEIAVREQTVAEVLDMIGSRAPRLTVLNKVDLVDEGRRHRLRALYPEAVLVAAARGEGLEELRERLAAFFDRTLERVRLLIPYDEAGELHRLHGVAADIREEHTERGVLVDARLTAEMAGRYARFRVGPAEDPEIGDEGGTDGGAAELDAEEAPRLDAAEEATPLDAVEVAMEPQTERPAKPNAGVEAGDDDQP